VSLRQRYNLSGTRTYGVDGRLQVALASGFDAELFATVLSARADPGDAAFRNLLQRPSYEVGGALHYRPVNAALLRVEYRRVGAAVDLDAFGNRAGLPASDEINLRGQWKLAQFGQSSVSVTLAVDNLANDLSIPQLGLPLAGRMLRLGLRID
jgi:outer membrane receptor protein involved in Fe transport